ncbi:hypothetical protein PITC_053340 [Penicillium italicum]|uniref:Uncharacterized protein n=1 Tax=Penicillium italicum TaxID=40296 RepID=A0A0A2KMG6_PENIT|nr:hypothetical protein PITC_053340 [Penicillium italicum]
MRHEEPCPRTRNKWNKPLFRISKAWNGDQLYAMLCYRKANSEAIRIQVVGSELDDEECCSSYIKTHDPFLACVRVPKSPDKS